MTEQEISSVIEMAVRAQAAMRPRPSCVTQKQAAEMLNVSQATITNWIKAGRMRLNKAGMVSITEVDRLLEAA